MVTELSGSAGLSEFPGSPGRSEPPTERAGPSPQRPLAVTADEDLLDDLVRLAAAAGVVLDVAHDVAAARPGWVNAPLVLVGADRVEAATRASPLRRRDVLVVSRGRGDSALFSGAVELGADRVVVLPDLQSWLVERLADAAEGASRDAATISVVGGRGGAGASTLAAVLALTASRLGLAALLLDGDPVGGGIDLVLGGEDVAGLRWPDLVATRGRVSATALRSALPHVEQLPVLSWDRGDALAAPREATVAVLAAARRGSDVVVVDLPRHLDAAAEETLVRSTTTLLVVPAEVRAVAAAGRVVQRIAPFTHDVRVVVRGPAPYGLAGDTVASALGLPVVATLEPERHLPRMLERGEAPGRSKGPLATFCRSFLCDHSVVGGRVQGRVQGGLQGRAA